MIIKEVVTLAGGKKITFPTRMVGERDLERMEIDQVDNGIYFNKTSLSKPFSDIPSAVRENMVVINYPDFSGRKYENTNTFIEDLRESVKKQERKGSDIFVLPTCKEETDHMLRAKFALVDEIKKDKDVLFMVEISYKSEMSGGDLAQISKNTDFLGVFYGMHYGHYPSFSRLLKRLAFFKAYTTKRVFCIGMPLKFSGESNQDVRFMPCYNLVCDAWVKCWRAAGGKSKHIKVVDPEDFRSKKMIEWLGVQGRLPNTLIPSINGTVSDLFSPVNKQLREEFESYVLDEAILSIDLLDVRNMEGYINRMFDGRYFVPILAAYREKIIAKNFRQNPAFASYPLEELKLLESRIRKDHVHPLFISMIIKDLEEAVKIDKQVSISDLIREVDSFGLDS